VTITNAGPVGTMNLTVTVTDNCGAATSRSLAVTIVPEVKITSVSYTQKILTINGSGFGTAPTVTANGVALPSTVIQSGTTDTKVSAKGNKKKLSLRKGANTIQVTGLGGQKSNVFTFNLAAFD
jgi:hypothetical protein